MSWEIVTLLGVCATLVIAIGWYEFQRPSAKIVVLVATLAAVAVVGRIAFAPLPNVKPTTDIVFLSGYVLGAAPGAAVGATAAAVSNIFFGQGPWTPWQMLAWGLTGIFGGALSALFGRHLGRLPIALSCALIGLVFGAIMNFSTWTAFVGTHTLTSYLAVSASAAPFDGAHAFGNLVFALVAGPAFVRILERYRRRFQVSWQKPTGAVGKRSVTVAVLLIGVLAVTTGTSQQAYADATSDASEYLRQAQQPDGGFGADRQQASSELHTGWAMLGLESAGVDPATVKRSSASAVDYLRKNARSISDAGALERTIMVLEAANISSRNFAGRDLLKDLLKKRSSTGSIGDQVNFTAFGILALRAVGKDHKSKTVRRAVSWMVKQQGSDGGFSFAKDGASSVDMTAAVVEALVAAKKKNSKATRRAVKYLNAARNLDGGYGQFKKEDSNAQSTAWAVQALVAAGVNVEKPLEYLRSLQQSDGSIRYSRSSEQTPVWVTAQALPALTKQPFPLRPVSASRKREVAGKLPFPLALAVAAGTAGLFVTAHRRRAKRLARAQLK